MFPLIRSTGSKKQSKLAAHAPFSYRLTAPISIPSNNSSQGSNRSYAKSRRELLSSFGEQSPLFSKGFPKKNAKLISQTRATPNLIEKCSSEAQLKQIEKSLPATRALVEVLNRARPIIEQAQSLYAEAEPLIDQAKKEWQPSAPRRKF